MTAALSVKGCIYERDARIADQAARIVLIARDSAQILALRDSVVSTRASYDSAAKALRSALRSYQAIQPLIPTLPAPQLIAMKLDYVPPEVIIQLCADFVRDADSYKLYADSTMAAQARMITNLQLLPQKVVEKSSRSGKVTAFLAGSAITALTFVAISR